MPKIFAFHRGMYRLLKGGLQGLQGIIFFNDAGIEGVSGMASVFKSKPAFKSINTLHKYRNTHCSNTKALYKKQIKGTGNTSVEKYRNICIVHTFMASDFERQYKIIKSV